MEAGVTVKRLRRALCFFAAMICALTCRGEPAPRIFLNSGYGFKLVLTDDWDNLSPADLKALNAAIAKVKPDWPRPALQGGYLMTNAPGFVFRPQTIIRVVETGAASDEKTIRAQWNEGGVLPESAEMSDPV